MPAANFNFSGEYVNTDRRTVLQIPVIAGYTTGRLQSQSTLTPAVNGTIPSDELLLALMENDTNAAVSVQFQTTSDRTVSGTRTNLGSAIALAAYGRKTLTISPTQNYLEVLGVSGTGNIRVTLTGLTRWNECAFGKDEAQSSYYPYATLEPTNLPPILGPINPTDGPTQFNW